MLNIVNDREANVIGIGREIKQGFNDWLYKLTVSGVFLLEDYYLFWSLQMDR